MDGNPPPVVIVDDDDGMRNALDLLLRAAGFEVRAFASAEQLLSLPPALSSGCLILDVHLPGLSGFDLWEKLRPSQGGPAVIFITAQDTAVDRARARKLDAAAYLSKPFAGSSLLEAVRQAARKETHVSTI